MSESRDDTIDWWESGPVFSTVDHGRRIMRVRPEFALNPRVGDFVVGAAVCAVCTALAVWGIAALFVSGKPAGFWWFALVIPAALLAGGIPLGMIFLGVERYGRGGIGGVLGLAGLLAGLALGFAVVGLGPGLRALAADDAGWPNPVLLTGAVPCALACLVLSIRVPFAYRAALRGARRILRLRSTAPMYAGTVLSLPDPHRWPGYGPVPIRYRDAEGDRMLTATMYALSFRIPMPGTRVIVFVATPPDRAPVPAEVHIELDPDATPEFDPNTRRYEQSADGGSM